MTRMGIPYIHTSPEEDLAAFKVFEKVHKEELVDFFKSISKPIKELKPDSSEDYYNFSV